MKSTYSVNNYCSSFGQLSQMLKFQRSLINKEASLKIPSDYLFVGADIVSMINHNTLLRQQIALLQAQLLMLKNLGR